MIPVYPGYKTWCDQCGWNLEVPTRAAPNTLFQKLNASVSQESRQRLLDEMLEKEPALVAMSPARLLSILIAGFVHSITVAFLVLGIWLLIFSFPVTRFLGFVLGLFCLAFTWLIIFPHLPRQKGSRLPRAQYPALYDTVNRTANSLNSSSVDNIQVDLKFNASFSQVGWKRTRTLTLGLPLLSVLSAPELVALLGHELAHGISGDPNRGLFVGSALYSLARWYQIIHPANRWHIRTFWPMALVNIAALPVAGLIWLIGYLLSRLLWYDNQRAEYLADLLAAKVSGTNAVLNLLAKVNLSDTFETTLILAYVRKETGSLFDKLKRRINNAPAREVERVQRLELLSPSTSGSTHPPTAHRVAVLKAHYISKPALALSSSEHAQLEHELEPLLAYTQQRVSKLDDISFRETFGITV